jgi:hypothetical protein
VLSTRSLLVGLIVAATALFVVGAAVERGQRDEHAEPAAGAVAEPEQGESREEAEHQAEPATAERGAHEESSEEILGVNPESPGLVAAAAIASLLIAAAAWRWFGRDRVLWLVAAAMIAFAALDVREVAHQIDESRSGVAALAALVAALHLAAAGLAAYAASSSRTSSSTRRAMSSRTARTSSTGRPFGSGRSQSR